MSGYPVRHRTETDLASAESLFFCCNVLGRRIPLVSAFPLAAREYCASVVVCDTGLFSYYEPPVVDKPSKQGLLDWDFHRKHGTHVIKACNTYLISHQQ